MAVMSPLCLYAPDTHFARLKSLWVNHASYDVLSDAIVKLTDEWQDLIINVRMGLFLNLQSPDSHISTGGRPSKREYIFPIDQLY